MIDRSPFEQLCQHVRETALWESIQALLEWDERTKMPEQAGDFRAEQITQVSGLVHRRHTEPRVGEWLQQLETPASDLHSDSATTIRQLRRDYNRRVRMPQALVEAITRESILGQQAWVLARAENNYAAFAPHLTKMIGLKREQAQAIGYSEHPYDALLDEYEPAARTSQVALVLSALRKELAPLVANIVQSARRPDESLLTRHFPVDAQESFGRQVAQALGFDFRRGRLDVTHHPFCSSMGPHDCRITTRYDAHYLPSAFFGTLHEAGHGMYDQGLRADQYGLPPGTYVSLGIHESQSRLWENFVGRRRSFWSHFLPLAQQSFPAALSDVKLDDFYFAINAVRPSLIRVEADEATYNLHIIIRFELEQALITGELSVAELPAAWRQKYRENLGIEPPTDADGVLQDIHWSAGLFGYFPTYTLGNLYAAQFFEAADRDLGGLDAQFERGEFQPLLAWLQNNIHRHGQCYTAAELGSMISQQPLSPRSLMSHLRDKLEPLYEI